MKISVFTRLNRAKLAAVFLCLLGLSCLVACRPEAAKDKEDKSFSFKLGMLAIEDNLPFFVAEHDGLFKELGLDVELVPFNSARERDLALEAGKLDGQLADIVAAALLRKGGTRIKIVSLGLGATPQEGRFVLLAAPDSNITEVSQLKGLPIAVSQHTIIHYLTEEMLLQAGVSPEELSLQNIPDLKIRLEALLAGVGVKAALLPEPLASLAEKSGARPIIDDTKLPVNLSQTVILFREEILANRGSQVKKILQAYQEAAAKLNADPHRYRELIREKARVPKEVEDSYQLPRFSELTLPSEEMVQRVMNWMVKKGLLKQPYSYDELVARGYLNSE